MKNMLLVVFATLVLAGCVSKYKAVSYEAPSTKLVKQESFYVMLPPDGQYGDQKYSESGAATARAIAEALAPHATRVHRASTVEDIAHALGSARQGGFKYVFQTVILNWEDRATEWSGIPDKISLQFAVYDTTTGEKLASAVNKASSKWATFGGDHPQDLLPAPTQIFVDGLF